LQAADSVDIHSHAAAAAAGEKGCCGENCEGVPDGERRNRRDDNGVEQESGCTLVQAGMLTVTRQVWWMVLLRKMGETLVVLVA
jgi:hypothetical protein